MVRSVNAPHAHSTATVEQSCAFRYSWIIVGWRRSLRTRIWQRYAVRGFRAHVRATARGGRACQQATSGEQAVDEHATHDERRVLPVMLLRTHLAYLVGFTCLLAPGSFSWLGRQARSALL